MMGTGFAGNGVPFLRIDIVGEVGFVALVGRTVAVVVAVVVVVVAADDKLVVGADVVAVFLDSSEAEVVGVILGRADASSVVTGVVDCAVVVADVGDVSGTFGVAAGIVVGSVTTVAVGVAVVAFVAVVPVTDVADDVSSTFFKITGSTGG